MFRPPPKPSAGAEGDKENLIIPRDPLGILMDAMWGLIGELHETSHATSPEEAKNATLVEAIQKSELFLDAFAELPERYHDALKGVPQFIENMEAAPLVASSAESDYTKAGVSLLEYAIDDFDGDQVFLQDGYTPIIQELARPLEDAGVIDTGSEVTKIDYSGPTITISAKHNTYHTSHAVVTTPLGILKHSHTTLFTPSLPSPKIDAIKSLGFGTLDKIFLIYPSAWWAQEPYHSIFKAGKRLNVLSSGDHPDPVAGDTIDTFMGFTHYLSGLSINPSPNSAVEPGPRILSYINLHALTGYSVLGIFVSCANALAIENMTNAEAKHFAHRTFVSWLPKHLPAPPEPSDVHVTRWAQDEFSRGSYSHMIAGVSDKGCREEFGKPVRSGSGDGVGNWASGGGEVRFAGEHTSEEHFATAHGALLSGWREADGIIAAMGKAGDGA